MMTRNAISWIKSNIFFLIVALSVIGMTLLFLFPPSPIPNIIKATFVIMAWIWVLVVYKEEQKHQRVMRTLMAQSDI